MAPAMDRPYKRAHSGREADPAIPAAHGEGVKAGRGSGHWQTYSVAER